MIWKLYSLIEKCRLICLFWSVKNSRAILGIAWPSGPHAKVAAQKGGVLERGRRRISDFRYMFCAWVVLRNDWCLIPWRGHGRPREVSIDLFALKFWGKEFKIRPTSSELFLTSVWSYAILYKQVFPKPIAADAYKLRNVIQKPLHASQSCNCSQENVLWSPPFHLDIESTQ